MTEQLAAIIPWGSLTPLGDSHLVFCPRDIVTKSGDFLED